MVSPADQNPITGDAPVVSSAGNVKEAQMRARDSKVGWPSLLPSLVLGVAALAAGGMACQEDEPPTFSTGVDRDKPLGTVNGPEAQAVCTATQTWTREAIAQEKQQQLTCRVTATLAAALGAGLGGGGTPGTGGVPSDAQLRMTCQVAYDRCLLAPAATEMGPPTCQAFPAGCTATVGEYEACLTDIPPFVDSTLTTLPSCESLSLVAILSLANLTSTLPETCKTFQSKCRGAAIGGLPPVGAPAAP